MKSKDPTKPKITATDIMRAEATSMQTLNRKTMAIQYYPAVHFHRRKELIAVVEPGCNEPRKYRTHAAAQKVAEVELAKAKIRTLEKIVKAHHK